jgi:hypothetical protein
MFLASGFAIVNSFRMPFSSENGRIMGYAMPYKSAKSHNLGITFRCLFVKVLGYKELLISLCLWCWRGVALHTAHYVASDYAVSQ